MGRAKKKEKKAKHEERCKSDGTVDYSGIDYSKMYKMLKTIKRNTMLQSQRSRSVASRTRAANTRRRASEYRTPGTRKSSRLKTFVTKRTSSGSRLSNIPE